MRNHSHCSSMHRAGATTTPCRSPRPLLRMARATGTQMLPGRCGGRARTADVQVTVRGNDVVAVRDRAELDCTPVSGLVDPDPMPLDREVMSGWLSPNLQKWHLQCGGGRRPASGDDVGQPRHCRAHAGPGIRRVPRPTQPGEHSDADCGTYRRGVGQARAGTGDPHGVPKPAQPVDQASVYGVAARPHPAPGDGVDLGDSPAAALQMPSLEVR